MDPFWFPVKDKTYIILGLARSGLSTAKWLNRYGATVYGWDDSSEKRAEALEKGISLLPIQSFDTWNIQWDNIAALVQSPGIPFSYPNPHPLTAQARLNNISIISDCDLFCAAHPDVLKIGITGTNGKSTTTALVTHILNYCSINAYMGANCGRACFDLPHIKSGENGAYVLELSSFQLEISNALNLSVPTLINIGIDHLDRHDTMENYVDAKKRIFETNSNFSPKAMVVGVDDSYGQAIASDLKKSKPNTPIIQVSATQTLSNGVYVEDDYLIDAINGKKETALNFKDTLSLNAEHNRQNTAMAYAIAISLGLEKEKIVQAIHTFPGLEHRQEVIGQLGNITFINDSKATNAMSTETALKVFKNIYWIAGGVPKTDGIGSLLPYFPKIKQAFLIGKARFKFAATIQGLLTYAISETLEKGLQQAVREARKTNEPCVILLSPACASFDQFKDFEDRGNVFKKLVKDLCDKNQQKGKACA